MTINQNEKRGITVNKGDHITISAGIKVTGTVLSAYFWGGEDGWHIEMTEANVPGGVSMWKQRYDGGYISELRGQPMGRHFKTEENLLTVFDEQDNIAWAGTYERFDERRFILKERAWSAHPGDHYLRAVLAYYPMKNEFVTWMYNRDFASYDHGHYFDVKNYTGAVVDYLDRSAESAERAGT